MASSPVSDAGHNSSSDHSITVPLIELGRRFVKLIISRALLRPHLSASSDNSTRNGRSNSKYLHDSARAVMLASQESFLDFIRQMKSEDIVGFWPPWCQTAFSSLCFSWLLMIISSNTYEEAKICIEHLQSTRKELRLKATPFPVLRLGLLRIDSIFWRGIDKVLALDPHVDQAFRDFQRS